MDKPNKKNLILGLVKGYDYNIIKPFILSLKKTGFKGDVCFFISELDKHTIDSLRKHRIHLIPFKDEYPFLSNVSYAGDLLPEYSAKKMLPNCSRYIMYYLFMLKNKEKYSKVFLIDVRDVIFQRDPFDFKNNKGLCCFLEEKQITIKNNRWNAVRIKKAFGRDVYEKIADKNIVCSGVTMGETKNIMDYLMKMTKILTQKEATLNIDQAVHNYLIYTNQLRDVILFENEKGPVLNLSVKMKGTIRFNKEGFIIDQEENIINIIHQYDRHIELVKKIYKEYHVGFVKFWLKNMFIKLKFNTKRAFQAIFGNTIGKSIIVFLRRFKRIFNY
ncbi:MAG: hypothetical protein ACTSRG_22235 [Candidatus Helarchaeota archaeon]